MGSFQDRYTPPEYSGPQVVMFPDRIHHGFCLAAERDPRYRYQITKVRSQSEVTVLLGRVYLDEVLFTSFLRIEYSGRPLREQARARGRRLGRSLRGRITLKGPAGSRPIEAAVTIPSCPDLPGYQVELWHDLEPPLGSWHSSGVLDRMGRAAAITRIPAWSAAVPDFTALQAVEIAFEESEPGQAQPTLRDDNSRRSHQEPRSPLPSAVENTVEDHCYRLVFRNGYYFADVRKEVQPVTYLNAMMDPDNPDARSDNLIAMRWLLQRELGGSMVFAHTVTLKPEAVEGVHLHIGSEEMYYFVSGTGVAYLGEKDVPELEHYPTVWQDVQGIGDRPCKEVPVGPHSAIYTKSGGIHGVRNTGTTDLIFFACLQHSH